MADFIDFEADASDDSSDDYYEMDLENHDELVDESENYENNKPSFFKFHNQTRDVDEVLREAAEIEAAAAEHMEANNYNNFERVHMPLDEFENFEQKKELFLRTLKNPLEEQTKQNSFYSALLYAIRFCKTKKSDLCEENELKNEIGLDLFSKLESKKDMCILNLIKRDFDYMCFDLNEILIEDNMFLRVYELKDKFRYLFHENIKSKHVIRRVSSCIKEKFSGFHVALPSLSKGQKKDLTPINIIYIPVKSQNEVIECFFTEDIRHAFRGTYSAGQEVRHTAGVQECYYCSNHFFRKGDFDKHIKICGKKPGVVYDVNLQNVVTFEDNIKYKGDLPFSVYADFETTAPTSDCLNLENSSMFAVSYALVFAWHPKLNLKRQIVVRGYNHSLDELADVSYLTQKQLAMRNQKTAE